MKLFDNLWVEECTDEYREALSNYPEYSRSFRLIYQGISIGSLDVEYITETHIELVNLHIAPSYRHEGYGSLIMNHLPALFPNLEKVSLLSLHSAVNFYKRLGYTIYQKDGKDIRMEKLFKTSDLCLA